MADKKYKTVMLIDDNEIDNLINQKMIEAAAIATNIYTHTGAKSALEFLRNVEHLPIADTVLPDIIFLDIHLQPYNGFEMLAMLQQLEWTKGRPIIALTASVMSEEVQQLRSAGFNGCLAKPIDMNTFPEIMERILEGETIWRILD